MRAETLLFGPSWDPKSGYVQYFDIISVPVGPFELGDISIDRALPGLQNHSIRSIHTFFVETP